jgi:hypothetical protein
MVLAEVCDKVLGWNGNSTLETHEDAQRRYMIKDFLQSVHSC